MIDQKPALLDMTLNELRTEITGLGEAQFRAAQVYGWLMKGRGIDGMGNIPAKLKEKLSQNFQLGGVKIIETRRSEKDGTEKYLYALEDGNVIEGVLMSYQHGHTLCVSTQVGCRMGCAFCASTKAGLVRNLTAGEMLAQVITVGAAHGEGRQITNLVLMGSGEPLDNYDNVLKFLRIASSTEGLGISPRNISVSTCGLPSGMDRLAGEGLPLTLCLSLHSPDDKSRAELIPAARSTSVQQVIDALKRYVEKTGRRAIIEYALIDGVNDTMADVAKLAALVRGVQCHVNLIPLNNVAEAGLKGSPMAAVERFLEELTRSGVSATKRRTLGEDIEGACGQLRRRHLEEGEKECP
jgi:23S rRNA (adenine2503-C2)-methyltransferase